MMVTCECMADLLWRQVSPARADWHPPVQAGAY